VAHVDPNDPPLLLIHGDQDSQMPVNQSLELQSVYQMNGRSVEFINVHGGAHGGTGFYDAAMLDRVERFLIDIAK
jgi:dipeptidyl aminopeptidase/acylaminoacyl peptidase